MREPLTLPQVKLLLADTIKLKIDPGIKEMVPQEIVDFVQAAPDIQKAMHDLETIANEKTEYVADVNAAIADYAEQSGQGQMFMDNLRLCLEQVKIRKQTRGN